MRIATLLCFGILAVHAEEPSGIMPAELQIMGRQMLIVHEQGDISSSFLVEYIPEVENLTNWTMMFAIRYYSDDNISSNALMSNIINNLQVRKKSGDPLANGAPYRSEEYNIIAYDSLMSDGIKKEITLIEHNTQWFKDAQIGVIHYQIATRHYITPGNEQAAKTFIAETIARRDANLAYAKEGMVPELDGLQIQQDDAEGPPNGPP